MIDGFSRFLNADGLIQASAGWNFMDWRRSGTPACRLRASWGQRVDQLAVSHVRVAAGIRPAAPGFRSVTITPQLGPLTWLRGELPHPSGTLTADLAVAGERLTGAIALPHGVTGVLAWRGAQQHLSTGIQMIALDGASTRVIPDSAGAETTALPA